MVNFCSKALKYSLCSFAFFLPCSKALLSISLGTAVVFFILKKLSESKPIYEWFLNTPLNKALFYFLTYCVLSLFWNFHSVANLRGLNKFLEVFFMIFLILDTFKSPQDIKLLLTFLMLGGVLISLNGFSQFLFGTGFLSGAPYGHRISSTFKDPTTLSAYLASVLPLSFQFLKNESSRRMNIPYLTIFLVILCLFLLCYSRNTIIFLSLSISSVFLIFNKKIYYFLRVSTLALIIVIGIELFPKFTHDTSFLERVYLWKISMRMIQDAPLLGHGLNSYSQINQQYFPIRAQDMPYSSGNYLYLAYPHNSYLKLWVEIGLIGLFFYLTIYYCLFRYIFKIMRSSEDKTRFKLNLYLVSIMTFLTSAFFDTFLESTQTRMTFWLVVGLIMAELRVAEQAKPYNHINVEKHL